MLPTKTVAWWATTIRVKRLLTIVWNVNSTFLRVGVSWGRADARRAWRRLARARRTQSRCVHSCRVFVWFFFCYCILFCNAYAQISFVVFVFGVLGADWCARSTKSIVGRQSWIVSCERVILRLFWNKSFSLIFFLFVSSLKHRSNLKFSIQKKTTKQKQKQKQKL